MDGFTPEQRFFLAYAGVWAANIRPEEILRRTKEDPWIVRIGEIVACL